MPLIKRLGFSNLIYNNFFNQSLSLEFFRFTPPYKMSQNISSFEITNKVSSSENRGLVIIQSKIYKNFSTTPSMNSFHFKQCDFIFEDASVDKANFYVSLLNEGVEIVRRL